MKIDYDKVPHQYARCFQADCPKVATCLRRLVAEAMPASEERCMIVSPKYLATVKGDCPYYRSSQKIRYAIACARRARTRIEFVESYRCPRTV